MMMKNKPFRYRLSFALNGLLTAWKSEASFRVECFFAVFVFFLLMVFNATPIWWGLVVLITGSVLAAELINTSLEYIVDRLHPETHPIIARAKDCAAAAVLILSITAVAIFVAFLINQFF